MIRNILFILGLLIFIAAPALAAVEACDQYVTGDPRYCCWEVDADDTAAATFWPGGKGQIWVEGDADSSADFKITYTPRLDKTKTDVDTDQMPDGMRFSSAATANTGLFEFARGWTGINFTSTGQAGFAVCRMPVDTND